MAVEVEKKKDYIKEILGAVGIAGGIVAGLLGLLAKDPGLFVLAILSAGAGWYIKKKS